MCRVHGIKRIKMPRRCQSVKEIIEEVDRILFTERSVLTVKDSEYYFRGESMNFQRQHDGKDLPLGTSFPSYVGCVDTLINLRHAHDKLETEVDDKTAGSHFSKLILQMARARRRWPQLRLSNN